MARFAIRPDELARQVLYPICLRNGFSGKREAAGGMAPPTGCHEFPGTGAGSREFAFQISAANFRFTPCTGARTWLCFVNAIVSMGVSA